MGMTLMADDVNALRSDLNTLSRAVGQVEGAAREIKDMLREQNTAMLENRNAAITRAEEKEIRDEGRFKVLDEKATLTGGRVSVLEKIVDDDVKPLVIWFRDEGSKLGGRVSILEQSKVAEQAEKTQANITKAGEDGEARGFWRSWGLIGTGFAALTGLIGWLGKDALAAIFDRLMGR